jgi:hypothetical protein
MDLVKSVIRDSSAQWRISQAANYDLFRKHVKRAGIERKDALGSVLHLHSFRKTWQTLGVRYGVNQRGSGDSCTLRR